MGKLKREVTNRCYQHPKVSPNRKPKTLCEECWRRYIETMDYYRWEADYDNMDSDYRNGR